ncbi:MAG: TIGR02206 family membrane protein [Phycisphaerales bacterium]|nr:TIGR02206 family membrane protein [Phycisphaerales bacterium]
MISAAAPLSVVMVADEPAGWLHVFVPFSVMHALVIVVFAALTSAMVMIGLRWRGTRWQRAFERSFCLAALTFWVIVHVWELTPGEFNPTNSLPLHLCDVSAVIAALALMTSARGLRALLYFWGLGLNTQAFITPLLQSGPAHLSFWTFWGMHFLIVMSAVYDLIVRGFRPQWRDYAVAVLASLIYLVIVLPIDIAFGFNYGYVGNTTPHRPTIVDVLGPWPQRVVVISLLVCATMALLMLPWEMARRVRQAESRSFPNQEN